MYMPIYFLELELRQICVKHDDFVCKYFLVNVSISYDSGSEMPSGRSARFLQLADLLCVTVALLHIWLNQQEVLHLLSHWACGQSSGQNFQEEARTARGPKRPNFMELGFQYQILGSRMKMNCTFVCLFLKKYFQEQKLLFSWIGNFCKVELLLFAVLTNTYYASGILAPSQPCV